MVFLYNSGFLMFSGSTWGKVFKNGPSKIYGRQAVKKFEFESLQIF